MAVRFNAERESADIFYNKSNVQIAIFVVAICALIALGISYGVTKGPDNNIFKRIGALVVDPDTHQLTSISGALFLASAVGVGLVFWAVIDDKNNRFPNWIYRFFANKSETQMAVIGPALIAAIIALPFILLTAQGCEPFEKGWKTFSNLFAEPTGNVGTAIVASLIAGVGLLILGFLAMAVASNNNEGVDDWLDKKSSLQCLGLTLLGGVALWSTIFAIFAAKGIWDGAWDNLKHLITDQSPDSLKALPAVAIIMGAAGFYYFSVFSVIDTQESIDKRKGEWNTLSPTKKALATVAFTFLITSISLLIMGLKGASSVQDLGKEFIKNPVLVGSIAVLVLAVATFALTYFYKK